MNHQAEAHILGSGNATGHIGLHMNANLRIVVPITTTFGPPPAKQMAVDSSKVAVVKKG